MREFGSIVTILVTAALLGASPASFGQAYPAKPIRLIVPYPPGGIDPYARIVAPRMTEELGQPIVIENRPGANGFIGSEVASRSAPDGYTLLFATSSTMVAGTFLSKNLPFDPQKDFTYIISLFEALQTLAVRTSLNVNTVQELIDYARKNPGKLSYNSSGIGSVFHLNGELFKMATGVDIVHVPYGGTGPMAAAFAAGQVEVSFPGVTNIRPFLPKGEVKVLAVLEPKRYSAMPNVPTMAEIIPGFRKAPSWIGYLGPAGIPRPIVERVNASVTKALAAAEVRKFFDDNGAQAIGGSPDEFTAAVKKDFEVTGALVKKIGIQPE
jgi:tripartite-type tricarboxylate transporter receptor subunit TctC